VLIQADTSRLEIAHGWTRADHEQVNELAQFPVALIGDAQNRMDIIDSAIQLRTPGLRLAGTILPVLVAEGDNLAIHRALDDAQPGDVLVINGHGATSRAVFGGILAEMCRAKAISGVVVDGAIRDVDELATLKLPTFSRAVTPAGPWKHGPGRIGHPVACGHIVCHPGDAIIGDSDGLVIVSNTRITAMLDLVLAQEQTELRMRSKINPPDSPPNRPTPTSGPLHPSRR
jgi:regulator of RNase E activity RraA